MNTKFKITTAILSASLIITPLSGLVQNNNNNIAKAEYKKSNINELYSKRDLAIISLIDNMPMEIAEGNINNGVKWLNENKPKDIGFGKFIVTKDGNIKFAAYERSWACVAGIGTAVVSLLPWSKILKLKQGAKALGGLHAMASQIYNKYRYLINNYRKYKNNKWEAMKAAVTQTAYSMPEETRGALLEFFGLGGLTACFD